MNYPVNEVFETIQGEGYFTGTPAIFVRLQGCPVGCSWCDTKHTWELLEQNKVDPKLVISVDGIVGRWAYLDVTSIVDIFQKENFTAKHVVITGGEPCLYDLTDLTTGLHQAGYKTQIETSGTFTIMCPDDTWVTVSPKMNMKGGFKVLTQALERANEIKHPVATEKHIAQLDGLLSGMNVDDKVICLQPISQKERATAVVMQTCIQRNWRLSIQTHKYLDID